MALHDKKKDKDLEYQMWSTRLSKAVITELKRRYETEKSWNQLFEKLLKIRKN